MIRYQNMTQFVGSAPFSFPVIALTWLLLLESFLYYFPPYVTKHYLADLFQVMIKNLEQVVNMVLNSFQDPHPRVRWAAINAIGQLSTDLGPDLQVQYHSRVLPALAHAMDDFQNPRVQVGPNFILHDVKKFNIITSKSCLFVCDGWYM